jgi:hypothetical protein
MKDMSLNYKLVKKVILEQDKKIEKLQSLLKNIQRTQNMHLKVK